MSDMLFIALGLFGCLALSVCRSMEKFLGYYLLGMTDCYNQTNNIAL